MLIGLRLRELREAKYLSQGDIEKRTGLIRAYTSRVENGHTTPSVETLEKYARALEIPLYRLFHEGKGPITKPHFPPRKEPELWGSCGKESSQLRLFIKAFKRMSSRDRMLLLEMARRLARCR